MNLFIYLFVGYLRYVVFLYQLVLFTPWYIVLLDEKHVKNGRFPQSRNTMINNLVYMKYIVCHVKFAGHDDHGIRTLEWPNRQTYLRKKLLVYQINAKSICKTLGMGIDWHSMSHW